MSDEVVNLQALKLMLLLIRDPLLLRMIKILVTMVMIIDLPIKRIISYNNNTC